MCLGGTNLPKAVGGFLFIFMNVHACSINTPSVLVCLSSILFRDVSKYCHIFKNKNH